MLASEVSHVLFGPIERSFHIRRLQFNIIGTVPQVVVSFLVVRLSTMTHVYLRFLDGSLRLHLEGYAHILQEHA